MVSNDVFKLNMLDYKIHGKVTYYKQQHLTSYSSCFQGKTEMSSLNALSYELPHAAHRKEVT